MAIKEKEYVKASELRSLSLDEMYKGSSIVLENLSYDLNNIINTEGPITYNTLKERLRECFQVAKISGKALDIIIPQLKKFNFEETDNLFDKTIWPDQGVYNIDYVRVGYQRQIYDIPREEISNVFKEYINLGLAEEELYHKVLNYFGYQVLTKKAFEYLNFVYKKL